MVRYRFMMQRRTLGPEVGRFTKEEEEALQASLPYTMAGARYFGHLGSTLWFVSDVRLVADHYDEVEARLNRELCGIEAQPPVGLQQLPSCSNTGYSMICSWHESSTTT